MFYNGRKVRLLNPGTRAFGGDTSSRLFTTRLIYLKRCLLVSVDSVHEINYDWEFHRLRKSDGAAPLITNEGDRNAPPLSPPPLFK